MHTPAHQPAQARRRGGPAPRRSPLLLTVASAGLAVVASLSACDQRSAAQEAINDAAVSLRTGPEGNQTDAAVAARASAADRASAGLGAAIASENKSVAASAALLRAEAKQTVASAALAAYADVTRLLSSRAAEVEAQAALWNDEHAKAAAVTVFDPADDIARLRQQASDRQAEEADLQGRLDTASAEAADMTAMMEGLAASANEARQAIAQIRDSLLTATATQTAARSEEIYTISRRADGLEKEVQSMQARLDADVTPRIAELRSAIGQRVQQRDLLAQAIERLQGQRRDAERRATEHRAAAAQVEQVIVAALAEIEPLQADAESKANAAIEALQSAAGDAGRASSVARGMAASVKSAVQRRLAEAHTDIADQIERLGRMHAALAATQPPITGAASFAERAATAAAAVIEHRRAAAEAYEAAASDLRAGRPQGVDPDALEAAAAAIDALARGVRARLGEAGSDDELGGVSDDAGMSDSAGEGLPGDGAMDEPAAGDNPTGEAPVEGETSP